jgi:type IV fimbrial biogenesis protein FimT
LVEALVVMSIGALLLGQALPALSSFLGRRQLEGLSMQLQADMHEWRARSVASGQGLRLSLPTAPTGGSCYVVHTGDADACACSDAGQALCQSGTLLLRSVFIPDTTRVQLSANVKSLRVDPRQGTVSPAGSLDLSSNDGSVRLRHVVNIMGRVRLCMAAGKMSGVPAC